MGWIQFWAQGAVWAVQSEHVSRSRQALIPLHWTSPLIGQGGQEPGSHLGARPWPFPSPSPTPLWVLRRPCPQDVLEWKTARTFFYWRLRLLVLAVLAAGSAEAQANSSDGELPELASAPAAGPQAARLCAALPGCRCASGRGFGTVSILPAPGLGWEPGRDK